jgi:hypothetical protein
VSVANRQVQTAAKRAQDDIGAVVSVADRLVQLDAGSIELSSNGDRQLQAPLLDRVRSAGTLRVGVWHGFRGLNFAHPKTGKIVGMEVDLLEELGRALGVRIEMVDAAWVDLPKKLKRREFDLLFCALIPDSSYRGIRYSAPYLDMGLVAMRRAGDASVTSAASLSGRTVGIIADPAARQALIRPSCARSTTTTTTIRSPTASTTASSSICRSSTGARPTATARGMAGSRRSAIRSPNGSTAPPFATTPRPRPCSQRSTRSSCG